MSRHSLEDDGLHFGPRLIDVRRHLNQQSENKRERMSEGSREMLPAQCSACCCVTHSLNEIVDLLFARQEEWSNKDSIHECASLSRRVEAPDEEEHLGELVVRHVPEQPVAEPLPHAKQAKHYPVSQPAIK